MMVNRLVVFMMMLVMNWLVMLWRAGVMFLRHSESCNCQKEY